MKKILVLGASGYIGSRLIPFLLDRGYHVRAVSRSLYSLRSGLGQTSRVELFGRIP